MEKVKAYLWRYLNANQEISLRLDEINRLRTLACKVTVTMGQAQEGGSDTDRTQALICHIVDLERDVEERINKLAEIKRETEAIISTLGDSRLRVLLRMRYIGGWTWGRISQKMYYSKRQLSNLHQLALKKLCEAICDLQ